MIEVLTRGNEPKALDQTRKLLEHIPRKMRRHSPGFFEAIYGNLIHADTVTRTAVGFGVTPQITGETIQGSPQQLKVM